VGPRTVLKNVAIIHLAHIPGLNSGQDQKATSARSVPDDGVQRSV